LTEQSGIFPHLYAILVRQLNSPKGHDLNPRDFLGGMVAESGNA